MKIYVSKIEKDVSKTGNQFIKAVCLTEDKKDSLFYVWDNINELESSFNSGKRIFEVQTDADLKFPKIISFQESIGDLTEFMNFIYPSDEYAVKVFDSLCTYIQTPFLKKLIETIFSEKTGIKVDGVEQTVKDLFCVIPAAKAFHHDYRYGLLQHTHELMTFVSRVCSAEMFNTKVDINIALCGALLHDVGKIYEYEFDGVNSCDYGSDQYRNAIYLSSHLYKGGEMVECAFQKMKFNGYQENKEDRLIIEHLKHIIGAHHLQREWAAIPKQPQTLEAYLVFLADYFSAAFGKFNKIEFAQGDPTERHLIGSTSKFDTFFNFNQAIQDALN